MLPWQPQVNGSVELVAVDPRGRAVYAGGSFTKAGGVARTGLAAFDTRTAAPTSWDPDPDGDVSEIVPAPAGSPVYVGGSFASVGHKSRRGLAAVDAKTGAATAWDPNISGEVNGGPRPEARDGVLRRRILGSRGSRSVNLAAVERGPAGDRLESPDDRRTVGSLRGRRGGVVVGGELVSVGAVPRGGLAAMPSDARPSPNWPPPVGVPCARSSRAQTEPLYIGGRFRALQAKTQQSLAVIDTATRAVSLWGPAINSTVWSIAPTADGARVFLGGAFTTVAGKSRRRLAALDATTGTLTPWTAVANALVRHLAVSDEDIYATGDFNSIGGESRKGVAALDSTSGRATGWEAPAPTATSSRLVAQGEQVYVGGAFTTIGGKSRKYLAQLEMGDGSATRWDPAPDDVVRALAMSTTGNRLYVAGDFLKISGGRRDLAEYDMANGLLTGWRPYAPFSALAVAVSTDGSGLYVGLRRSFPLLPLMAELRRDSRAAGGEKPRRKPRLRIAVGGVDVGVAEA